MKHFNTTNTYLVVGFLIYSIVFGLLSSWRFDTYNSEYYDMGIMTQTIYNTSQGRILELTTPEKVENTIRFAIHSDPILAIFAPFYRLLPDPRLLLWLQAISIGIGGIVIYQIGRKLKLNKYIALLFALAWWLYVPLQWSIMYDFHGVVFASLFMLLIFWANLAKRNYLLIIFTILALLTKENVGFVLGVYFLVSSSEYFKKELKRGGVFRLFLGISCILWSTLAIFLIAPYFRSGQSHFAFERYIFGGNIISLFVQIIQNNLNSSTFENLLISFGSFLLLPFWSIWTLLPLISEIVINFTSNSEATKGIYHHYSALMTPFLFLSALYGYKKLPKKFEQHFSKIFIIMLLVFSIMYSPLPYSKKFDAKLATRRISQNSIAILQDLEKKLINENITISATNRLAPRFANRKTIARFPAGSKGEVEYILVLLEDISFDWFDPIQSKSSYDTLQKSSKYSKIIANGEIEVYRLIGTKNSTK